MHTKSKLEVLILHDHRAGHLNPCLGVYDCISTHYETKLTLLATPHITKLQISLLKKLSKLTYIFDLFSFLKFKTSQLPKNVDCIICSGMPNLLYGIFLSRSNNIPLFYAGDLRNVNERLVTCIFTAVEQKYELTDQVILPTPPVKKEFYLLQKDHLDESTALLVLGGPTDEHPFSNEDFKTIIFNFLIFCEVNQLIGMITNSRRTPELSDFLQHILTTAAVKLDFYDHRKDFSLIEMIGKSTYIFVTEDSTSMLAETIQSGRFVSSIYCTKSILEPLNRKYLEHNLILRQSLNENFKRPTHKGNKDLDLIDPIVRAFKRNLGY